eukprot:gnl/Trimastix_PCT/663.p1 GENE.gnl/Trimastix_PCT/663~~gnl/Trimastix_PCT/663.p1  ORF type:complete len:145 (-),score=17.08 gnl/Trimastix_PCT/663:18-452(-)
MRCRAPSAKKMSTSLDQDRQRIVHTFQRMRSEVQQIGQKILELESERNEHGLVIGAMEKLDTGRKCFRMVGSVLVERTIGETLPALQRNKRGIDEVLERLGETLQQKQREMSEYQTRHKIKVVQQGAASQGEAPEAGKAGGVLA